MASAGPDGVGGRFVRCDLARHTWWTESVAAEAIGHYGTRNASDDGISASGDRIGISARGDIAPERPAVRPHAVGHLAADSVAAGQRPRMVIGSTAGCVLARTGPCKAKRLLGQDACSLLVRNLLVQSVDVGHSATLADRERGGLRRLGDPSRLRTQGLRPALAGSCHWASQGAFGWSGGHGHGVAIEARNADVGDP